AAAALLTATILGYLVYLVAGREGPDPRGLATKLIELLALPLVLVPVRGERSWRGRRWTILGAALPALTVVTVATVWIDSLARPDPRDTSTPAPCSRPPTS